MTQLGMNITPEMMRTQAAMMKNMDASQFEMMKKMAANMNPNMFPGGSPYRSAAPPQPTPPRPEPPKEAPKSTYPQIEKIKNKGNDQFRANNYEQAASSYYEV